MHVMNGGTQGGISPDKVFPRGSILFAEGMDPNAAFPKTSWTRISQGRVLVGIDEADTDYDGPRKAGGAKQVALSGANNPAHGHSFTGSTVYTDTATHTHPVLTGHTSWLQSDAGYRELGTAGEQWGGNVTGEGDHGHTTPAGAYGTVWDAGGSAAHNNLQPYIVCDIWERADGPYIPAGYQGPGLSGLDKIYPAGAVLYAMEDVRPAALYGGQWERIKGRCVVFVDEQDADFVRAMLEGGSRAVALSAGQMPVHHHAFTGSAIPSTAVGAHTHSLYALDYGGGSSLLNLSLNGAGRDVLTSASHYHTATFTGSIGNAGSGAPHENRQPYLTCYMWRRVS